MTTTTGNPYTRRDLAMSLRRILAAGNDGRPVVRSGRSAGSHLWCRDRGEHNPDRRSAPVPPGWPS